MAKLKNCKHCGAQIAASAKVCPQCGGKNKKPIYLRAWFIILVLIIVIGAVAGGSGGSSKKNGTETKQIGTVSNQPETGSSKASDSDKNTKTAEKTSEPTPEPKTIYEVGDILKDGNMQIVYVSSGEYQSDNQYSQPKEGHKYVFLEFAFINDGKSDASVSFYSFDAYADGYSADMYYGADDDLSATLSAGRSTLGRVYFEVPVDANEIEVEYSPNVFLDRKIKFVYEGERDSGFVLEPNTARADGALSVGETLDTKNLKISYLRCEDFVSDNMFIQPRSGYHFVFLELEYENTSTSDKHISSFSFDCYADGIACDQNFFRDDDLSATISAGRKVKGTVAFEVPDNATVIEAEFNDNVWTSSRIVFTVK